MGNSNEKLVTLINSLIKINTDRIDGYEKAAKGIENNDLQVLFNRLAGESRKFRSELISEVIRYGGSPSEGNTLSGDFYLAWIEIKSALTNRDEKVIIKSCEFEEDVALDAYNKVIKNDDLPQQCRDLITQQKNDIQKSHDQIKLIRDGIKEIPHL